MIVISSSKIICCYTIFLHDHPITLITPLNGSATSHSVINLICFLFCHTNTYPWLTSFLSESFFLYLCQIAMCIGIFRHLSFLPLCFSFFFKFIFCHKALIC